MTISTNNLLENIRNAVIRRNWEKRNDVLLLLLQRLGRQHSMELAVSYGEWYLPRFIEKHPTETWAETRLGEVRTAMSMGFDDDKMPVVLPELYRGFDDSLSRTFQRGTIYSLWAMIRPAADTSKSIEFARDAIASVLTIVRNEYREWIPDEFMKDGEKPSLDELEFGIWFDLLSRIEAILNQKSE